ncbi:unnamed protein product [Hydatigera taeniaeformis]|uniref:Lipid-binding serum glycoprotein N-terminal domain-containing protein n=1 Tax=Hydatigena taeniaeformis TaxID=6205 RepID=A0A3P7G5N6_HYDTA|nr:unnamed protein product [Hydatigera taeniaeformis]
MRLFHVLLDYGMRLLHAGKDFFEVKDLIRVSRVELQNIRIHNLKSIYEASVPELRALPVDESMKEGWKVTTRCFSIDLNIGLRELTVSAESKLKVFFKTKFHPFEMIIKPLVLHVRLRVCFPFLSVSQSLALDKGSASNLPHFATFSIDLEDVEIKHWKGVRIKGKGTFNKVAGFLVNSGVFTDFIRGEIGRKVRKYMPLKFAELKDKIHCKLKKMADKTIDLYAVKIFPK